MTPVGQAPPSGQQYELAFGDQRAVVTEVGAGLRSYTAGDRDVIDGYGVDEMSRSGRGQVLAPWPNRIEDGAYTFGGRRHQVPINEVEAHNAIHGLVRWAPWSVGAREPDRVVLEHVLYPSPGYPFTLALAVQYSLDNGGLTVSVTAANAGREPCPYGIGAHPYLTLGTPVDALELRVPARTVLRSDARGIPREASAVDGTEFDFRVPRRIGPTVLDSCFTDLDRDG